MYRWDGSSLTNISNTGFTSLSPGPDIAGVGTYFVGQQGSYYDLYLFDGSNWTLVSNTADQYLNFEYCATSGGTSYYIAQESVSGYDYLYKAVGGAWTQVSTQAFYDDYFDYATEITGSGLFFYGRPIEGDAYVYRLHDGTLDRIDHAGFALNGLSCSASNDTDLFFNAGNGGTGKNDFYRVWDNAGTWTIGNISNTGFNGATPAGWTVNNDVYFWQWLGMWSYSEVFRWDSTALVWEKVTNEFMRSSGGGFAVGNAFYFGGLVLNPGTGSYEWAFYRCDADGYSRLSDYGIDVGQYAGSTGSTTYWIADTGAGYDLFSWNGTSFTRVTTNNFSDLSFATQIGGALYFSTVDGVDSGCDIYRYDGSMTLAAETPLTAWQGYVGNLGTEGLIWQGRDGSSNYYFWFFRPITDANGRWSDALAGTIWYGDGEPPIAPFNRDYYFSGMLAGGDGNELMRYWGDYQYLTGRSVRPSGGVTR